LAKKKFNDEKKSEDPKSFSGFLKKRAPIYLGIIGLFMIFAYPALTEKNLESLLADDSFEGNERIALEMVKFYKGSNDSGISVIDVIEEKINDKHDGQKIFDHEKTWADFTVEAVNNNNKVYEVVFVFNAENNEPLQYEWHVNIETGEIDPRDTPSKIIIQRVDYYD
jgi:hypothetical protein|tara:strand:- start:192 stop:692 length:501 start_codon:yes stop_codon:yes gene_type:complete